VEKREVYAVLIPRDGHRWACKYHYDLVKSKKVRPHISLIFGPRKGKKRHAKRGGLRKARQHFKKMLNKKPSRELIKTVSEVGK
jgi:hypothetical protein